MATLDHAALVRGMYGAWNAKDLDRVASCAHRDARMRNVPFGAEQGFVEYTENWAKAFPDGRIEVTNLVVQGDVVVAEFTGRGSHTGPLKGPSGEIPPTNRSVELPLVEIYRFTAGKIAGGKVYFDAATLFDQLHLGSTNENKALIRAAFRDLVDNKGAEGLEKYCRSDFHDHQPPVGAPAGDLDAAREGFERLYRALPDVQSRIDELISEGDRIFVRGTFTGTHQGELMGLQPTGKRLAFELWHVFRVVDGKVAEHWAKSDALELLRQIGATPRQMADVVEPPGAMI
jgi:predicted ester cyclase